MGLKDTCCWFYSLCLTITQASLFTQSYNCHSLVLYLCIFFFPERSACFWCGSVWWDPQKDYRVQQCPTLWPGMFFTWLKYTLQSKFYFVGKSRTCLWQSSVTLPQSKLLINVDLLTICCRKRRIYLWQSLSFPELVPLLKFWRTRHIIIVAN